MLTNSRTVRSSAGLKADILVVGLLLFFAHQSRVSAEVFRDADGAVYSTDIPAGESALVAYPNLGTERTIRSDRCGRVRINSSDTRPITDSTSFTVDGGAAIAVSALSTESPPSCGRSDADPTIYELSSPEPATNYISPGGSVYLTGLNPEQNYTIEYVGVPLTRKVRASCPFIRISSTTRYPLDTDIVINGTTHTIASLTEKDGPRCSKGTAFLPESWPTVSWP